MTHTLLPPPLAPALSPCSLPGHRAGCKDVWISLCRGKTMFSAPRQKPRSSFRRDFWEEVWCLEPVPVPVEGCLTVLPRDPGSPTPERGLQIPQTPQPAVARQTSGSLLSRSRGWSPSSRRGPGLLGRRGLPAGRVPRPGLPPPCAPPRSLCAESDSGKPGRIRAEQTTACTSEEAHERVRYLFLLGDVHPGSVIQHLCSGPLR